MSIISQRKRAIMPSAALHVAAGGGGAGVTWTAPTSHVAITGSGLIATSISGTTSGDAARSSTSHSSGLYYVEVELTNTFGGMNEVGIGLIGSTFTMGPTNYVGSNANSIGVYNSGTMYHGGTDAGGWIFTGEMATGDRFCLAINLNSSPRKFWARKNNQNWLGEPPPGTDPVTGTGPIDISTLDPNVYVACDFESTAGSILTAKFASTSWIYANPSGFGQW